MSKINSIQPNYQSKTKAGHDSVSNFASKQSFGEAMSPDELKPVYHACKQGLNTKMVQLTDFLAQNEGEIENQVINAIFTSTLAPLMIAFNPFSKKDKKDKAYLSLRQPISAAIAIGGSLPATMYLNKVIARWGSEGQFKNLDMRICPNKDYLKSSFNERYSPIKHNDSEIKIFEDEIKLDEDVRHLRTSKNPINKFLYKANLKNAYYKNVQDKTVDFFAQMLNVNCGKDMKDFGSRFKINDKGIISILDEKGNVIVKNTKAIPNLTKPEQLKEYLKTNSIHNKTFGDFMKDNFGFEFYNDGAVKPDSTLRKLKEVSVPKFMEKLGLLDKIDAETLARVLSTARQQQTVAEYEKAGVPKTIDIAEIIKANTKLSMRDLQAIFGENLLKDANMSLSQLLDRFHVTKDDPNEIVETVKKTMTQDEVKADQVKRIQKLMEMPIADVMENLKGKLVESGMEEYFNKDIKVPLNDITQIAKRYAKSIASKAADNFKNAMKFNGIVSNLFITMATCTILNWAYPRIVESLFPSLVKADKPSDAKKGGN